MSLPTTYVPSVAMKVVGTIGAGGKLVESAVDEGVAESCSVTVTVVVLVATGVVNGAAQPATVSVARASVFKPDLRRWPRFPLADWRPTARGSDVPRTRGFPDNN